MNLENKGNRKEWVKNVAIIFLTIMLILTFFSNTIMNYSLPEVATAYVEPGSITAKIRGTGTLTSEDPYMVSIEESRVISSVAVKQGDTVEKDQILFYLEDKESTELEAAEEALLEEEKILEDLLLAFSTEILKGEITNQSYDNVQRGDISTNNEYQARISAAKQKVDNAQATVDSISRQESIAGAASGAVVDKEGQLTKAKADLETAMTNLSNRENRLKEAEEAAGQDVTTLVNHKHEAQSKLDTANLGLKAACKALYDVMSGLGSSANPIPSEALVLGNQPGYEELKKDYNKIFTQINNFFEKAKEEGSNTDVLKGEIGAFQQAYESAAAAAANYNTAAQAADTAIKSSEQLNSLKSAVSKARNQVNECQARVNALTNEINNNTTGQEKQKADLAVAKINAEASLAQAQKELSQLLTDVSGELNLDRQNDLIGRQRERIEKKRGEIQKLREKAVGATVKAPVAGIVTSISVMAGDKTEPMKELAVMQPEGKGYSMSVSVTAEQAKQVKVGEKAEIQNAWFYSDIEATLTGIRPDPENSNEKKLLVFDVKGDVQAGQSVSLSIGQRSAEYDLLVPNSAVREDNQGKFILIVESKNSPLGNRYIAKRVDVQVLAADDLKTAISAPIYGYEYVIATSTQPVEAGKQVRLADTD